MSLLQNEDFVLYQLRTAYLSNIKDGVGERLISVNTSVLNNPAFRASGWLPNTSDIKRTYSPPIPTAVASEYFQAPRSAGLAGPGFGDDDEEGGMVTGRGESTETVGPMPLTRRRRRKEQLEEEDSSDLSDDSDEDADGQRGAQQIKFTKMPVRSRAGSSPIQKTRLADAPELIMVTSPSRPPETSSVRRGSLSALDTVQERPRRDTVTSSEMSSENELDPSVFKRKQISSLQRRSKLLSEKIQEDDEDETEDSDLDSDFAGTADSNSLLGVGADALDSTPPPKQIQNIPPAITPHNSSPNKRTKQQQAQTILPTLPPARPISVVQPVSALTQALKAKSSKPADPVQRFGILLGQTESSPLYIKIYAPFSSKPTKPFELLLRKTVDEGTKVIVAEAIGCALFKYQENGLEPPIPLEKKNINKWVLRMIEDEEVDYEFPPFARTRPIQDFTSTNNRPVRGRARDKPWDEFAIVEASPSEFAENEKSTPEYSREFAEAHGENGGNELQKVPTASASEADPTSNLPPVTAPTPAPLLAPQQNPITGPYFSAIRKDSTSLLDAPAAAAPNFTPRTGAPKTLRIHFISDDFTSRVSTLEVTTDTYLAEVFDRACRDLNVDKALYVLKVSGTSTIAPSDRTVEALGPRTELDLARRRFVGDGAFGLSGSPGSSSPNAPLLISTGGTPKKKQKGGPGPSGLVHPLAQKQDALLSLTATNNTSYKRYIVTRKQPMSFTSSSTRVLALDGEYMHIMPADTTTANAANKATGMGKTTTVHFTSVVGSKVSSKHPKTFRVVVFRERESKRYDFETQSREEAAEIVREIRKGMERFQEGYV
ncbi:Component of a membrane-bound complex containing the Tor2p kinase [Diplodia seriata]|uniref:Component of a membrane-bound complex containing the Tor2p kinase n=1 Tax=Diplodia seriata TaxID=420778 RepID=A0A0G2H2A8_9PEZI|nr:putative stress activated map kinase interacting protein sin1 [Diplodia seriata]